MIKKYQDRREAGDLLAAKLKEEDMQKGIIIGIPRGGVIVAVQVAEKLGLPLDIIIPLKIGSPYNPEVAVGAVTQDGTVLINQSVASLQGLDEQQIKKLGSEKIAEIKRRMVKYRGHDTYPDYQGGTIVLVDDGIATGFTVLAAIESIKNVFAPQRVILAVPVAPTEVVHNFKDRVDQIVCPLLSNDFYAVGQFYDDFRSTSDQEVIEALNKSKS